MKLRISADERQKAFEALGALPSTPEEFDALRALPAATLRALHLRRWSDESDGVLWLFPADWYDRIPDGYTVRTINDKDVVFRRGKTDGDTRAGVLAYGVWVPNPLAKRARR